MKYKEMLESISNSQLRALASQAKLEDWRTASPDALIDKLGNNTNGKTIFRENYGTDADIQN